MGLDSEADFIVLVDGEQVERAIALSPESVILGVELEEGTREILIGYSRVIPEFGALPVIALPIGLISVTFVSTRFGIHQN